MVGDEVDSGKAPPIKTHILYKLPQTIENVAGIEGKFKVKGLGA